MSLEDNIRALERTPVLAEIGREALRLLAFSAESRPLHAGEQLFARDSEADCAYTVASGRIRLDDGAGHERTVGAGTLIGEMALIVPTKRPCEAVAETQARVLVIPRTLFRRVLEEFPDIAATLKKRLLARLHEEHAALEMIRENLDRLPRG